MYLTGIYSWGRKSTQQLSPGSNLLPLLLYKLGKTPGKAYVLLSYKTDLSGDLKAEAQDCLPKSIKVLLSVPNTQGVRRKFPCLKASWPLLVHQMIQISNKNQNASAEGGPTIPVCEEPGSIFCKQKAF